MKIKLAEKIAGEITLSSNPGQTIKKWRETFSISQQVLAEHLGFSPSVISDYESGRRKSPGVTTVKRIVQALVELDENRGGEIVKRYLPDEKKLAILDIQEFHVPIQSGKFLSEINAKLITESPQSERDLHGYTVLDSVLAITTFSSSDYLQIYGWSNERALIFTGVKYGRSPMIAIRAHPLKPALVIYHQPGGIDKLAIKLADLERIQLAVTKLPLEKLLKKLSELY
ncbi:MAG: helix-turn-helix domain-containing protein [Thermoplasmata archaeon]|nr:MAG: helix-turn-helix domain-containing protein [Thermoplasmata archaeon]